MSASYSFEKVIDVFINLVQTRARELKLREVLSKQRLQTILKHLYEDEFVPFLTQLGLKVPAELSFDLLNFFHLR